jgi:hypothetical protein
MTAETALLMRKAEEQSFATHDGARLFIAVGRPRSRMIAQLFCSTAGTSTLAVSST